MAMDEWGNGTSKKEDVAAASRRHAMKYLANVQANIGQSLANDQAGLAALKAREAERKDERERFAVTGNELTDAGKATAGWAIAKNFAANAWDTSTHMLSQGVAAHSMLQAAKTRAFITDKAIEQNGSGPTTIIGADGVRRVANPFGDEVAAEADVLAVKPKYGASQQELIDHYNERMDNAREWAGNLREGVKAKWGTETYNPYLRNKANADLKVLNDEVDKKYGTQIEDLAAKGKYGEAAKLKALKTLEYAENASSIQWNNKAALASDLGAQVPYMSLGLASVIVGSGLQAAEDFAHSEEQYQTKNGSIPTGADLAAMGGMGALNFGVNFIENATALKALKLAGGAGKGAAAGTAGAAAGAASRTAKGLEVLKNAGKGAVNIASPIAVAAASNAVAGGIQDSIQRGWGALSTDNVSSRTLTEASVAGAYQGGALVAGGQAIGALTSSAAKGMDKAVNKNRNNFEDLINPESPKFNPEEAVRAQMAAHAKATDDAGRTAATEAMQRAVDTAETHFTETKAKVTEEAKAINAEIKSDKAQRKVLQTDLDNLDRAADPETAKTLEDMIAKFDANIASNTDLFQQANARLLAARKVADDAMAQFDSFNTNQDGVKGKVDTPESVQANADILSGKQTATPEAPVAESNAAEVDAETQAALDEASNYLKELETKKQELLDSTDSYVDDALTPDAQEQAAVIDAQIERANRNIEELKTPDPDVVEAQAVKSQELEQATLNAREYLDTTLAKRTAAKLQLATGKKGRTLAEHAEMSKEITNLDAQVARAQKNYDELVAEKPAEVKKADPVTDHFRNNPMLYTPEQQRAIADNEANGLTQNERGLYRELSDHQTELNKAKDDSKVTKEIVDGGDTFKGLTAYHSEMAKAVANGRTRQQERLIDSLSEFDNSMQGKADAATKALNESKTTGETVTIYKDQKNGQWLINRGEVEITDANRDKLGALTFDATTKGSARLADGIVADASRVSRSLDLLEKMQNGGKAKAPAATPKPTSTSTPPPKPDATPSTPPTGAKPVGRTVDELQKLIVANKMTATHEVFTDKNGANSIRPIPVSKAAVTPTTNSAGQPTGNKPAPTATPAASTTKPKTTSKHSKLTQDEYADTLAESGLPEGVSSYDALTARPNLRGMTREQRNAYAMENKPAAVGYADRMNKMWTDVKTTAEKGIQALKGESWHNYQINNDKHEKGTPRHKSYATLKNAVDISTSDARGFLSALRDAGYNGQVKFPALGSRALLAFDNIVMHGETKADAEKGVKVAKEFFKDRVEYTQEGTDVGGKSHTETMAEQLDKNIAEVKGTIDGARATVKDAINEAMKDGNAKQHIPKELAKVDQATQFIGDGVEGSSTAKIRDAWGEGLANTGNYKASDVVMVSSNGKRTGAIEPVVDGQLQGAYKNLDAAIKAKATIVADTAEHLNKSANYNTGEVAIANYLKSKGYVRTDADNGVGTWKPKVVGAGRLSLFEGVSKESRLEERALPYEEQNLVRVGFTQQSREGNPNPLIENPNFLTQMISSDATTRAELLSEALGRKITAAELDYIDGFVTFAEVFKGKIDKAFVKGLRSEYYAPNPIQFLHGERGFDENVTTAMAASAFSWVTENGDRKGATPDDIMLTVFGIAHTEGAYMPDGLSQSMRHASNLTTLSQQLGARVTNALGLSVRKDVGSELQGKLEASIGSTVAYALEHSGVLKVERYTNKDMAYRAKSLGKYTYRDWLQAQTGLQGLPVDPKQYSKEQAKVVSAFEQSPKAHTKLAKLVRKQGRPPAHVQNIVNDAKGGVGVPSKANLINEVFSTGKIAKGPSITKIVPMTEATKISGSSLAHPSVQVAHMNKAMEMPYRVRVETVNPLRHINKEHKDDFIELFDLNINEDYIASNYHISERAGVVAKREAMLRDVESAFEFIDGTLGVNETGGHNPVYLGMNGVRTQRMHIENNMLNPQASQVHRTMLTPEGYEASIKLPDTTLDSIDQVMNTDGSLTEFGQFLVAVAEHAESVKLDIVGSYLTQDVGSVRPDQFLPKFLDWVNSEKTQKGIKATANLMALSENGKRIPASVFKDMKATLSEMGMGFQSYHGLVALAEMYTAANSTGSKKADSFTTYLRAGSDGKTSGSAIANILSGTVDATTGDNSMSDGFGLITKTSQELHGVSTQFDAAARGTGDLYTTVNKAQTSRWSQLFKNTRLSGWQDFNIMLSTAAKSMDVLIGDFNKRSVGKVIANPTIYGSGTKAIKARAVSDAKAAIYKKIRDVALLHKTDPEKAALAMQSITNDLNNMLTVFNDYGRTIDDKTPLAQGLIQYRAQLEHNRNMSNPDLAMDRSKLDGAEFMASLAKPKDGESQNDHWKRILRSYNYDRLTAAPVQPFKVGELDPAKALNMMFSNEVSDALDQVVHMMHGKAHQLALKDVYAPYIKVRDTNLAMSSVAYTVYSELKKTLVERYIQEGMTDAKDYELPRIPYKVDENGKRLPLEGLSKKTLEHIEKQLYKARPIIVSPMSAQSKDPVGTGIMLTNQKNASVKDAVHIVKAVNQSTTPNPRSKTGVDINEMGVSVRQDTDPGVRGSVFPVISSDAAVSAETLSSGIPNENMHDNNYSKVTDPNKIGKIQNESFHNTMATYHMQVETLNMMMRALDQASRGDIPLSKESWDAIAASLDALSEKIDFTGVSTLVRPSMSELFKYITQARYDIEMKKLDYLDSIHTVHQYGSHGGEVILGAEHQKLRDESRAKLESDLKSKALGRAKRVGEEIDAALAGKPIVRKEYQDKPTETEATPPDTIVPDDTPPDGSFIDDNVDSQNPETDFGIAEEYYPGSVEQNLNNRRSKPISVNTVVKFLKEDGLNAQGVELLKLIEGILPKDLTINYFNAARIPKRVKDADPEAQSMIDRGAAGWYSPKANQINILDSSSPNSNVGAELLLHELYHAALSHLVDMVNRGEGSPALKEAVANLDAMRLEVMEAFKGTKNEGVFKEALVDVHEFISWGVSNKAFQQQLMNTVVRNKTTNGFASMFKSFVDKIMTLFLNKKVSPSIKRAHIPALEALLFNVSTLTQEAGQQGNLGLSDTDRAALPMINAHNQAQQQAIKATPREVFNALDNTGNSAEFTRHAAAIVDGVVSSVLERVGREHLSEGLRKIVPRSADARSAGFKLNDQEAYVVEAVEAVVDAALNNGAGGSVMKVLNQTYDAARKTMTPQSFHKGDWAHATVMDKALAQAQYDYVFKAQLGGGKNTTLARFAGLTLGSETVSKLMDFNTVEDVRDTSTVFAKMMAMVDYATNWVTNWMSGVNTGQSVSNRVDALIQRMADIDTKSRGLVIKAFEGGYDAVVAKISGLNDKSASVLQSISGALNLSNSGLAPVRLVGKAIDLSNAERIAAIPNALRELRNKENPGSRYGVVAETLLEFTSAEGFKRGMQKLLRGTKEIEKTRAATKSAFKKLVRSSFSTPLTEAEQRGMSYGLLRSGAHVLLADHSMQDIKNIMSQAVVRSKEIENVQNKVLADANGNMLVNQAKQLAWFMVSGNPTPGLAMNAQAIAQGVGTSRFKGVAAKVDTKLVTEIDKLATLWAIEYMDANDRSAASDVLGRELKRTDGVNGAESMLKVHQQLHNDAVSNRFAHNPLSMIKGWVPELSNPYVETRIAESSTTADMEAKGWKKVTDLVQDSADPVQKAQAIFTREGGSQRRVSGSLSLTDTHTKGLVITDGTDGNTTKGVAANTASKVKKVESTVHQLYDPRNDKSTQLFANFDSNGSIMNYSYRMNNNARDTLLQRKHQVEELLGEYAASSLDKIQSPQQNAKVMQAIHADYLGNFTKEPEAYVEIGPTVQDKGAQELWRMLPHATQKEMANIWGIGKPMYLRSDLVSTTFGYRKLTAGNIWNKQQHERNFAEKMFTTIMEGVSQDMAQYRAYQIGRAVDEITSLAKDFVVLRTPVVLLGNIKANMVLLAALGVNPVSATRDGMLAYKAGRAFQNDRQQLLRVEAELRAGLGNRTELQHRHAQLSDSMARNPLREFIESGTMPAIVDDVEATTDSYGFGSALSKTVDKYTSLIPKSVKSAANTAILSKGTVGHNFMSAATQYSDFVGRYILYKHLTEKKGMSHDDAVHEAMETFINYDLPSSPQVQWLNDTGILMFSKFAFRYQRVLLKVLEKNPALALSQAVVLGLMTDIQSALDPNIINKGPGLLHPGALSLPSAITGAAPFNLIF